MPTPSLRHTSPRVHPRRPGKKKRSSTRRSSIPSSLSAPLSSLPNRPTTLPAPPAFIEYLSALLEDAFVTLIIEEFNEHGWEVTHHPDSRRATGKGMPDLFCVHHQRCRVLWIEAKRERGRLSDEQKKTIATLRACNYEVHVMRPRHWNDIMTFARQ